VIRTVVPPLLVVLAACGAEEAQPLTVSEVSVFAPLPGQATAVAYFSLRNATPSAVTLRQIASPDFAAVEMHTTYFDNGVAHMQALEFLTIAERSEIDFTPGGHHLMLMRPLADLEPGDVVTLEFYYDDEGLLSLRAPVKSR
jgi:hypothetical protein